MMWAIDSVVTSFFHRRHVRVFRNQPLNEFQSIGPATRGKEHTLEVQSFRFFVPSKILSCVVSFLLSFRVNGSIMTLFSDKLR